MGHTSFNARVDWAIFGVIYRGQDSLDLSHLKCGLTKGNAVDINLESNVHNPFLTIKAWALWQLRHLLTVCLAKV